MYKNPYHIRSVLQITLLGGIIISVMNINFTQSDIDEIVSSFRGRLSQSIKNCPAGNFDLERFQRWAIKQNVDIPEVLQALLKKNRDGNKNSREPMPQLQKPVKISRRTEA